MTIKLLVTNGRVDTPIISSMIVTRAGEKMFFDTNKDVIPDQMDTIVIMFTELIIIIKTMFDNRVVEEYIIPMVNIASISNRVEPYK